MPDGYFLDLPSEGQWLPDSTIFPLKDMWQSQRRVSWSMGLNPSLGVDGPSFGDMPPTAVVSLLGNISAGLSGTEVVEGQPTITPYLKDLPDAFKYEGKTLAQAFWAKLHPEDEDYHNFCQWMQTLMLAGFITDPSVPEAP